MISVIIPMFNAEKTIIRTLDSVRNQDYDLNQFEIIIINDGSTDNSKTLVENYKNIHSELNIKIIGQENGGVSKARNEGLKAATGNYIALLDSDDEWLPQKTKTQMGFLEDKSLDVDFITCLRNGEKIWFPYKKNAINLARITLRKLLLRVDGQTSTALFKRKVLDNTGFFDEKQRYSEDANYWMKISKNNVMYILAQELVFTGGGKRSFGASGLSANLQEMEKGIQKNLYEMYQLKRISYLEYILFFIFSKLKYIVRVLKAKYDL
ncbi:glycosyltransferase family 2 protein [Chryseobacterium profundimaris]|uniref:Glycosyltransferase involved in cell wall bisynthesis n=1 Tax=Chryseobacterium profundimaris TaxID=1387275 RepID=A0ABY1P9Y6_9FLAO|nr:glycosyltransferase family A protein [Chryseobacterium profundimaris]SMP28909.1 Glycosyltransferase involved in cell wall bisynthesis [Chryseobacterium profundimaris]